MLSEEQMVELATTSPEAINDFLESLPDSMLEVERLVSVLQRSPNDPQHIHALFRALHSIKGNAAMCRLINLVSFAHPVETLVGEVRAGRLSFTADVGELILLCTDRVQLAAQYLSKNQDIASLGLDNIAQQVQNIAASSSNEAVSRIRATIQLLSGHQEVRKRQGASVAPVVTIKVPPRADDLAMFRDLANRLERRNPFFEGRTERSLQLARLSNEIAGGMIDSEQLEAAVYMHDVGMAFLPDELIAKHGRYTELELREMKYHPELAANLLERMSGWEQAALMVRQHHEWCDGNGYPQQLTATQICEGAKLLAIVDAFEAMTHERGDRYQRRSVIRAITEINASNYQFDSQWVKVFNQVARRLMEQNSAA